MTATMRKGGRPRKTTAELRAAGSWRGQKKIERPDPTQRDIPPTPDVAAIERICRDSPRLLAGYDAWADAEGYSFDAEVAHDEAVWFHKHITHVRGALGGQPFRLEEWQICLWCNLFGWFDSDGLRRYRCLYLYIPEKQGKTPLAAAIAIRLGEDAEPGFEIYSAAYNREQARLVWHWAQGMIRNDRVLSERWHVYTHSMVRLDDTLSFYKPIAAVDEGVHGANVYGGIIDEEHAFTTGKQGVIEVMESKTAARRQPLIVKISTAGYDRESICYRDWVYARKLRDREPDFVNPRHLPVIFEAATEADWTNPSVWKACNPNMGVSVAESVYHEAFELARRDTRKENLFRQLKLNQWTEQAVRAIPMEAWDRCPKEPWNAEDYRGQICWVGFDGAITDDLTALTAVFNHPKGGFAVKSWAWIPEESAKEREEQDRVPYRKWAKAGIVELTPGPATDWRYVERRLEWLKDTFQVPKVAFDPAKARQWAIQAEERLGVPFVEVPQTAVKLNEATETMIRLVIEGRWHHGGCPCLRWQASNAERRKRADDLSQLVKPARHLRIDGLVAGIMALVFAIADEGHSVYELPQESSAYNGRAEWDDWSSNDGW